MRARFRAESLAADADAAFACFGSALGAIVTLLPRFGGAIAGVLFAFTFSAARRAWSTFVTALSGAWTFCSCFAPPPLPLLRPASAASGVLLMRTCAASRAWVSIPFSPTSMAPMTCRLPRLSWTAPPLPSCKCFTP